MIRSLNRTEGLLTGAVLTSFLLAAPYAYGQAQPAGAPKADQAAPTTDIASSIEPKVVPASQVRERLDEVLRPHAGGITSDAVARKAEMTSPEVVAKQAAVQQAAAKVDQAAVNFAPRLSLTARYARLSPITKPNMGYIAGGLSEGPMLVTCPPSQAGQPTTCAVNNAMLTPFSFPILLNYYNLQAGVAIPITDYVLRITQNYSAATHSKTAAEIQKRASRLKVQRDARITFYNWVRARAVILVSEQGLATVLAHAKDVSAAVQVGSASKADLMSVQSKQAATELLLETKRNLKALVEEQLRTMLHDPDSTSYELGEDLSGPPEVVPPAKLQDMYREALNKRLEIRALDETVYSLRQTRKVVHAGAYPRVDAFANLYHQNPNTRVFPLKEEWRTTWDVGAQLTWTINDTFSVNGQAAELASKVAEIEAQKNMLLDGLRMEVTQTYNGVLDAQTAVGTTARQLEAAEESYRVRRELFRAGRATSAELTDAETDLMKSRLDFLNARIDARVAKVNLEHALGRDVATLAP